MIPIRTFAPDNEQTIPGNLLDCQSFIPYEAGFEAAPGFQAQGATALAGVCVGATTITKLGGSTRTFAGTADRMYELASDLWTDRSSGGDAYTTASNWTFAQFGDSTLISNDTDAIEESTSGAFVAITGAPKAKVIFAVTTPAGGFVFAVNTNDATYGDSPDRWRCSALNDATSGAAAWTVDASVTQANTGRLLGSGELTAGISLGASAIIFRENGVYLGTYVGPPDVWDFAAVPGEEGCGCVGPNAVCDVGTGVVFVGRTDIWYFDGSRPISIARGKVRRYFTQNVSQAYIDKTQIVYERDENRVRISFPGTGSTDGTLNKCLVGYLGNILDVRWGLDDKTVQRSFNFIQPSVKMDSLTGVMDDLDGVMDNPLWRGSAHYVAAFDSSNVLQTINGSPGSSYFVPAYIGGDSQVSRFREFRVRYAATPSTASASAYRSMALGLSPSLVTTQTAYDVPANGLDRVKLRQTARWHRIQWSMTGAGKVTGYEADLQPAGTR